MKYPLMPKATAIWLVENTALTFKQIAEFCGLHELEIHLWHLARPGDGCRGVSDEGQPLQPGLHAHVANIQFKL